METNKIQNMPDCRKKCTDAFLDCTSHEFNGCVEAYRICKEKCKIDPES